MTNDRCKILLVEDNLVNQQVTLRMLSKMGFTAQIACDGAEAVLAAKKDSFDLILMDMMLPVMDGLEASKTIRAHLGPGKTPIVALTANADPSMERMCLEAGMDGFLSKPFTLEELEPCLQKYLSKDARNNPLTLNISVYQTFLKSMGEDDVTFIEELFIDFMNEANRVRSEIHTGLKSGDGDVIARACHSLKGSAAILGADALRVASEEIEHKSKNSRMDDIQLRLSHFEGCINEIRSALDSELARMAKSVS